jgi:hypothetical protein
MGRRPDRAPGPCPWSLPEERRRPGQAADPGPDDHRLGQSGAEALGQECQHQRHHAAEERRLVVAEGARGRPYLGREALVEIRRHLSLHAAAGAHALQDEAYGDPQEVFRQQIERRERQGDQRRDDDRPAPAEAVGPPTPTAGREEQTEIGEEDRCRDERGREVQILLQVGREQRVDRVVGDEATGQPQAGRDLAHGCRGRLLGDLAPPPSASVSEGEIIDRAAPLLCSPPLLKLEATCKEL